MLFAVPFGLNSPFIYKIVGETKEDFQTRIAGIRAQRIEISELPDPEVDVAFKELLSEIESMNTLCRSSTLHT